MTAATDDFTGALNLINNADEIHTFNILVERFRELIRELSPIIEMECMSEYEYILEIYDGAIGSGQRVINNEFPVATTKEEFDDITTKMEDAVDRLESVDRVLEFSFINNFIVFF